MSARLRNRHRRAQGHRRARVGGFGARGRGATRRRSAIRDARDDRGARRRARPSGRRAIARHGRGLSVARKIARARRRCADPFRSRRRNIWRRQRGGGGGARGGGRGRFCSRRASRRRGSPAPSPARRMEAKAHDRAFHRGRPRRRRSSHAARPRSDRAMPGLSLRGVAGAGRRVATLPAGREDRRHRAAVARRDHRGDASGGRRRPRRRAAAFGRSVDLERGRRTDAAAGAAENSIHLDAGRALLRRRGGRARARTDLAGGRAIAGADAHERARLGDARERKFERFRRHARHHGDTSLHPRPCPRRRRADALLWRRMPDRAGLSRLLARRAHRPRHARHHRTTRGRGADGAHGADSRRTALGAEDFRESALYDAGYDRRFRPRGGGESA